VYLSCARADAAGVVDTVASYTITVGADGVADFAQAWQSVNISCTTDPLHPAPVVSSPVERAAVAATGTGLAATTIGTLYADCAARFDLDRIVGPGRGLGNRVGEFRGVLILCPRTTPRRKRSKPPSTAAERQGRALTTTMLFVEHARKFSNGSTVEPANQRMPSRPLKYG
jgi:hypothetical protein